jgi:lysozyme
MKKTFIHAIAVLAIGLAAHPAQAARVLGTDVSSAQGSVNWASVHADGYVFAFAKATEGTYYVDAYLTNNMVNGKAAGMQMGAYEYSRPDLDTPSSEANYFWNHAGSFIKADGNSLFPCVDFEIFDGVVGASSYSAWFNSWAVDIKAKTAVFLTPVILVEPCTGACALTSPVGLGAFIASENGENPQTGTPWNVCTSCNVWDEGGTGGWSYWLFGSGSITGISGPADMDVYNGNLAHLKTYEGVGGN